MGMGRGRGSSGGGNNHSSTGAGAGNDGNQDTDKEKEEEKEKEGEILESTATTKGTHAGATPPAPPPDQGGSVTWVGISPSGVIITYSSDAGLLTSHTLNGKYLSRKSVKERLHALIFSEDGQVSTHQGLFLVCASG